MWTCPKCTRTFRNTNQVHTCKLVSKKDFFVKRPPHLRTLFNAIVKVVKGFGEYREEAVAPDVIFLKTKSTFLAVKVKRDHLDLEFFLDHLEDVPPVSKFLQTSKRRVLHVVPVDSTDDIDVQLRGWLRASYELISGA